MREELNVQSFAYHRAANVAEAIAAAQRVDTMLIAGGTELVNWMKDAIVAPRRIVDLNAIDSLERLEIDERGATIGALVCMSDVADHPAIRDAFPVLSEALLKSASAQIRNVATIGGNVMQRTRCPYFRAEAPLPCNKRRAGSGCAALGGENRFAAIFGWNEHCVATHPSDAAVAFAALDASVHVAGPNGARVIPFTEFHRLPGDGVEPATALQPGEVITSIFVPTSTASKHSHYLKVRERASYEFALVSAAACIDAPDGVILSARIALGGVAAKPWRLRAAEAAFRGLPLNDAAVLRHALDIELAAARPLQHNAFKVELAARTALRAVQLAGGVA